MDKWIADVLGPYQAVALAFGALAVWWLRASLRKVHVLIFLGMGVVAGSIFCMLVLLLAIAPHTVTHPALALFGLQASAAVATAAASALVLSLLLRAWRKS